MEVTSDNLQDVINEMSSLGGDILFLDATTYHLTSNLVIPSNVGLQGVGSGGTIIDFGGGPYQIQIIGTLGNEIQSPFLGGMTVQNSSTDLVRVDYAINFGTNDLTCDTGASGVNITNTTTVNMYSSLQNNCAVGIIGKDSTFFTLFSSNVTNSLASGGVAFTNVSNSASIGCSVDTCVGGGYIFTNCSNIGFENFSVTNITGDGIKLDGGGNGVSISLGFIDSSTGNGINLINSASGTQITSSNTISNNGAYGITVATGSSNILIAANTFSSNTSGAVRDLGTGTLIRSNIGQADN